MKIILITALLLFSFSALALSKAEIKQSLDQMKKTGMFTEEQISAAEKQLMGMSEADVKALSEKGKEAAKDPEMQKKAKSLVEKFKQEQKNK